MLEPQHRLNHIADYLQFLCNAQSYWFMLNISYDHGCHLANPFHLGLNDYKVLFIAAGLAWYIQLRWHDERQCNNHPDKRHKRGMMLVILAGSDSATSQLAVSALQWSGWQWLGQWQQQQQQQQRGEDSNKNSINSRGEHQDYCRNRHGSCALPRVDTARQTHSKPMLTSASLNNWHQDIGAMKAETMLSCWQADSALRAGGGRRNDR